ncbi:MAG TPA: 2-oxoacid:acceptor oxidoreductase family protein, partial [Bacillota bacterium]|nr:2-oxoacid:acceptor oxidoreductase family protein [Bacillota bacterium]
MDSVKSILITGVGGQGTLLAARILGDAAIRSGYEAKVSEVHGMSQRGSVVTYVRYGKSVVSPLI